MLVFTTLKVLGPFNFILALSISSVFYGSIYIKTRSWTLPKTFPTVESSKEIYIIFVTIR